MRCILWMRMDEKGHRTMKGTVVTNVQCCRRCKKKPCIIKKKKSHSKFEERRKEQLQIRLNCTLKEKPVTFILGERTACVYSCKGATGNLEKMDSQVLVHPD